MIGRANASHDIPIFHQDWWLNTSTNNRVSYVDVKMGGKIVAFFPYLLEKRCGFSVIRMPKYTRTLGPYLSLPQSKTFRREQNIRHVVEDIVARLPKHHGVRFFLDPDNDSAFAFKLSGFQVNQDFTFRVARDQTLNDVWQGCDQKTRNLIRTAEKKLVVRYEEDIETFIELSRKEVRHNSHDFPLLRRLFYEAHKRGQATILNAYECDDLVSSAIVLWDNNVLYYWQSARSSQSRMPGRNMLLIWKAIEIAKKRDLIFDFDGFGSVRSAKMLASFGQKPVIRPEVVFESPLYKVERIINRFVKKHVTKKDYKNDF